MMYNARRTTSKRQPAKLCQSREQRENHEIGFLCCSTDFSCKPPFGGFDASCNSFKKIIIIIVNNNNNDNTFTSHCGKVFKIRNIIVEIQSTTLEKFPQNSYYNEQIRHAKNYYRGVIYYTKNNVLFFINIYYKLSRKKHRTHYRNTTQSKFRRLHYLLIAYLGRYFG